ncbi:Putative ribonuclease H protein [Arachis hypogaea]|nr:Putative ribonuclease H protein [Arachis hypogaea]
MMKIRWGLVDKRDHLWARVLRSKYRCGTDILPNIRRINNASNLWKGVCRAWKDVESNTIWRIGDGSKINFWRHQWIPKLGTLDQHANQVRDSNYSPNSLNNFLSISGHWDDRKLREWLPDEVVQRVLAMAPPSPWKNEDQITWALSSDGAFNLKSAYQSLHTNQNPSDHIFKLTWNWKGPERIHTFLWLCANDVILTNAQRFRRHMTLNPCCPRCQSGEESIVHVLRDCHFANQVWKLLVPAREVENFFTGSMREWLTSNLNRKTEWTYYFGVGTSSLWWLRNKLVFEGKATDPRAAASHIRARTRDIIKAMKKTNLPKRNHNSLGNLISWHQPQEHYVKINVDGSYFLQCDSASCGGVFRDHMGRFMKAFSCILGNCTIMHVELWGIVKGLQIAVANDLQNIIVESDSLMALQLLKQEVQAPTLVQLLYKIS